MLVCDLNNMLLNEGFAYFSCEAFVAIGSLLNFILLFLSRRKAKNIKASNIITLCTLVLGLLSTGAILFSSSIFFNEFNFTLLNGVLVLNNACFLMKFLFILFFILFSLSQFKINKKFHCYNVNLNLNILVLAFISLLFIQTNNIFLSYFFFELLIFFAYKYSSTINFNKEKMFAKNYVTVNIFCSLLFLGFYLISFLIKSEVQLEIINTLVLTAFLAKIGIFPLFNYATNLKHKNNISFCILSFLFLPFCGCILFNKILENIFIQSNPYLPLLVLFLAITMISCAVFSYLAKNLFKFLINLTLTYFSFCLINQILFLENPNNIKMLFGYFFAIFAVYCLISILKVHCEDKKINLKLIQGLSYKNYKLANLIILTLLFVSGIFPSVISASLHLSLREIYIFDKYIAILIFLFLFANCIILFGILRIIFSCYNAKANAFDCKTIAKKGMTLNYVIPVLILLSLFILNL